ncbi:MAG: M66 family metalloprotease, partial [Gemmatimonadota bacterium]
MEPGAVGTAPYTVHSDHMTRIHSPALLLLALTGAACSDFGTEPDRYPAEIRVAPDTVLLTHGETTTLEVTVLDQDGVPYDEVPPWAGPSWNLTDPGLLDVAPDGLATTLGPGQVVATAVLAGLGADAVVRINPTTLGVDVAFAYVTQSTQRQASDVPLVAGRGGLLRVYLTGDAPNFFLPRVVATFHRDGATVHTDTLTFDAVGIPESVDEGVLALSFDAEIPGAVLQPGTGLVIEVDPDGVVPATSASVLRHPATGEMPLDVRDVLPFRIRLVPVHQAGGLASTSDVQNAADRLRLTRDIFPIASFDLDLREPFTTEADLRTPSGWEDLVYEIAALRLDDASHRYYFGGFPVPSGSPYLGLGFVGYPVSIGEEREPETIAHEVGHNLNLPHAPCGGASDVDPDYPYANGSIGQYGWNPTARRVTLPFDTYDLMSYCDPIWISDYNYERVLAHRDT